MPSVSGRHKHHSFHEVLYGEVLPRGGGGAGTIASETTSGSLACATPRISGGITKAGVLHAILSPTAPTGKGLAKGRTRDPRAARKHGSAASGQPPRRRAATADNRGCPLVVPNAQAKGLHEASTATPSMPTDQLMSGTHAMAASMSTQRRGCPDITTASERARAALEQHLPVERTAVEARTVLAQRCAAAAGLRAQQIRAAAGGCASNFSPTPPSSSSGSCSRRSTTVPSSRNSPVCMLPAAQALITLLPSQLIFRITLWLSPLEVACLVASHRNVGEVRSELTAWASREVFGIDQMGLEAQLGTERIPALRLLFFLRRKTQAVARARGQEVAAGLQHSMVVRGGTAYSWGAASSGQLGRGSPAQQFHPVPTAVPLSTPVSMVACGGDHSLLVTTCGTVWAFGRNVDGQLGNGTSRDSPRPVAMTVPPASQVACGADHSLVLTTKGDIWACGRGAEGQLGVELESGVDRSLIPRHVREDVHLIACGADHSVAVDHVGQAWSFGENSKGQLGLGHCLNQYRPAKVLLAKGVLVVSADCGGTHTLFMADDTRVFGCGGNDQGQLGVGSREDRLIPVPVMLRAPGTMCRAQRVSCGFSHSLMLTGTGSLWVLGTRADSAIDGDQVPWRVQGVLDNLRVDDIAAGGGHALCLVSEAVFTFGLGALGSRMNVDTMSERPHTPSPKRVCI